MSVCTLCVEYRQVTTTTVWTVRMGLLVFLPHLWFWSPGRWRICAAYEHCGSKQHWPRDFPGISRFYDPRNRWHWYRWTGDGVFQNPRRGQGKQCVKNQLSRRTSCQMGAWRIQRSPNHCGQSLLLLSPWNQAVSPGTYIRSVLVSGGKWYAKKHQANSKIPKKWRLKIRAFHLTLFCTSSADSEPDPAVKAFYKHWPPKLVNYMLFIG